MVRASRPHPKLCHDHNLISDAPGRPATRSEQPACLLELQPRAARMQTPGITVPEVAQEVRPQPAGRLDLVHCFLATRRGWEEFLVHLRIVEARHGAAVQAE